MACLQDRVFIITHAGFIDVYRKTGSEYMKLSAIPNNDLPSPSDLAACRRHQRLYVSDLQLNGVWIIRKPFSESAIFEHFAKVIQANGLSVTPDGRLVITTRLPYSIRVYQPDGKPILHIPLTGTNIEDPCQATLDSHDNFIICSGLDPNHRQSVSKMSNAGNVQVSTHIASELIVIMVLILAQINVVRAWLFRCAYSGDARQMFGVSCSGKYLVV